MSAKIDTEEHDGDGDPDVTESVACAIQPVLVCTFQVAEPGETV